MIVDEARLALDPEYAGAGEGPARERLVRALVTEQHGTTASLEAELRRPVSPPPRPR